ncbi:MAG: Crp/Fnr family transcriptional regulator [Deltaproteobacteria bacterium]|nr:MAG: Crp/Fnr family transcriptional regulator [Deltaproteobacteria bacterium]
MRPMRPPRHDAPTPRPSPGDAGASLVSAAPEVEAEAIAALTPYLVPRRFAAGSTLWLQGSRAGLLVVLERGRVKAVRDHPDGSATLLYIFSPGNVFGFLPFVDGGPYPATAIAIDDVEARVMTRDALVRAIRSDPEVALTLLTALGQRLRGAFQRVGELAQRRAVVRVAAGVVSLLAPHEDGPTTTIEVPDPAYTFAEELGVTPETLSRELNRLAHEGALHRLGPRRWQVLDAPRLRAIAAGHEDE